MRTSVMSKADKVAQTWKAKPFDPFLTAFRFDRQVKNLTAKTLECYLERLGYLRAQPANLGVTFSEVDKATIQEHALSLQDKGPDETINGRIRVYRRFFGILFDECPCGQSASETLLYQLISIGGTTSATGSLGRQKFKSNWSLGNFTHRIFSSRLDVLYVAQLHIAPFHVKLTIVLATAITQPRSMFEQ